MTYKDIYTKYMIEYDKANVTSSYPQLTEYEIATILDKAYLALIAQKLTGNNFRRSGFETDIKAIEDLQQLLSDSEVQYTDATDVAPNVMACDLPLRSEIIEGYGPYYSGGEEKFWSDENHTNEIPGETGKYYKDIQSDRYYIYSPDSSRPSQPYVQVSADTIQNFNFLYYVKSRLKFTTGEDRHANATFVFEEGTGGLYSLYFGTAKINPVLGKIYYSLNDPERGNVEKNKYYKVLAVYSEGMVSVLEVDSPYVTDRYDGVIENIVNVKLVTHDIASKFFTTSNNIPWIKEPVCYIEDGKEYVVYDMLNKPSGTGYITYIRQPISFVDTEDEWEDIDFELNDSMAEELITLAIVFALENVESTRLNSKLNTKSLES